jgi:hypothetical protein
MQFRHQPAGHVIDGRGEARLLGRIPDLIGRVKHVHFRNGPIEQRKRSQTIGRVQHAELIEGSRRTHHRTLMIQRREIVQLRKRENLLVASFLEQVLNPVVGVSLDARAAQKQRRCVN